ncbi:hypothetical protein AYO20_05520 [Fonsecaea nubica]|uniref:Cytochrome P450 n=1 Tax=Fonsecaea nubica TaxID=856822 RepID=A0A178D0K8_9EURO|nr:hypothetical protein AYO20_05520 [Fonsecaea nubica]OAL35266.1 hypothetical protein AYO20_05520 [Fonsecaea nubica]
MAGTLFYLMQQQRCMKLLVEELDRTFEDVEEIRLGEKLTSCVYLRACVEEALRMASPAPGVAERTVLRNYQGGTVIDGEFLDEGTTIGVGGWATSYNPKYIREPDRYWPERHIAGGEFSAEEVQQAHNAYWPFLLGVRKCPGRKLAYNELHLVIARLVYLFEITPENPEELKRNFDILDHNNPKKIGPFVSFRLRTGKHLPTTNPSEMQDVIVGDDE